MRATPEHIRRFIAECKRLSSEIEIARKAHRAATEDSEVAADQYVHRLLLLAASSAAMVETHLAATLDAIKQGYRGQQQ